VQTDQIRDEIAAILGWLRKGLRSWIRSDNAKMEIRRHPIQPSLDTIAAIWKEHLAEWRWWRTIFREWYASFGMPGQSSGPDKHIVVKVNDTNDELHDRLELTLACLEAQKGNS
jgi:hypothetical protein